MFADAVYYRYFSSVLSSTYLCQSWQLGTVSDSIVSLIKGSDIFFFIDTALFLILILVLKKFLDKKEFKDFKIRVWLTIPFLLCGVLLINHVIAVFNSEFPKVLETSYNRPLIVRNTGIFAFHMVDTSQFVSSQINKRNVSVEEMNLVNNYIKKDKEQENDQYSNIGKNKNLIVVQVEALQGFVINRTLNGKEITPNLNRIISKGIYFDNYFNQVSSGNTSDAEFLSNVSLYPIQDGAVFQKYPLNKYESLPSLLAEQGYTSVMMHPFKPDFWNRTVMSKSLAFNQFYSEKDFTKDEIIGFGLSDRLFFSQAVDKLRNLKSPYYGLLITLSSHHPFNNVNKYGDFNVGQYEGTMFGNYLKAIHYTDKAIGELYDKLQKDQILNDSVLVIYGDHGGIKEDNAENLAMFLNKKKLDPFEWQLEQRVPLVISGGPIKKPEVKHIPGGQIDFFPTIANIMGIKSKYSLGRNLLNLDSNLVVFRDASWIDETGQFLSLTGQFRSWLEKKNPDKDCIKKRSKEALDILRVSDLIIENDLLKKKTSY